jgi:branched-chain amino acid transport system substrate-binding protein
MTPKSTRFLALSLGVAIGIGWAASAQAASKGTILIGEQCDRTGPTQIVGTSLCPGTHDYISLINSQGGVDGWQIKVDEIDHEYKVPLGLEAYSRFKQEGAVGIMIYGTPQTYSLIRKLQEDKIPGTSPGFGSAAAEDGKVFPYLFPIAATYWSQGAAAIKFAQDHLGGSLKGKKIAFIFYDNPAGREPIPIFKALQKQLGFELRLFPVPAPAVDVSAQCLAITQSYHPDFVINHLFGKGPALALKCFRENGFPLNHEVAFVWAVGVPDIEAAGGWSAAQGYYAMQFAGVGENYPVIQQIKAMYKKEGKAPPAVMKNTVYYNRGVQQAMIWVAAVKNALKLTHGKKPTGTDVKKGFEMIRHFSSGGLTPPLTITPSDHEGGGWVQIFQVKGNGYVKVTPWFRAHRKLVVDLAEEDAPKLAAH